MDPLLGEIKLMFITMFYFIFLKCEDTFLLSVGGSVTDLPGSFGGSPSTTGGYK